MFSVNNNALRHRARKEKNEMAQNIADANEVILSLTEENASLREAAAKREQEITDLQAQVLSLVEGGAK